MNIQKLLDKLKDTYGEWDSQVTVLTKEAELLKKRIDYEYKVFHSPTSSNFIHLHRKYDEVMLQIACLTSAYNYRIKAYVKLINSANYEK